MQGRGRAVIMEHFQGLTDPRMARAKRHNLLDIVALTLCAVLCGADNRVEIAEFGQARADGRRGFLALPNGIPSHDTLGRVFRRLDPEQFQAGFLDWVRSISKLTQGEGVAIDGKTLRGSGARPRAAALAQGQPLGHSQSADPGASQDIGQIQRNHRHSATAEAAGFAGLPGGH